MADMFGINTREIWKLERDLETFAERAIPFATKATVNTTAFQAQAAARSLIHREMINRANADFTARSVQVDKARGLRIDTQAAFVGSTAPYMETQEFGGTTDHRGSNKTVLPTSFSAGQGSSKVRTKLPTRTNELANIRLGKKIKGAVSRRQGAFLRGLLAVRGGNKYVHIPSGEGASSGIYRVWGTEKKNGSFRNVNMRMVYSFRRNAVRIPATPWLKPSVDQVTPLIPLNYRDALIFQRNRLGLFSGR